MILFYACIALNAVLKLNRRSEAITKHRRQIRLLKKHIKQKENQLKAVQDLCKEGRAKYLAIQGTPEGFAVINEIKDEEKISADAFYSNKSKKVTKKKKKPSTLPPRNALGNIMTPSACFSIFQAYTRRDATERIFESKTTMEKETEKLDAMIGELKELNEMDEDGIALAQEPIDKPIVIKGVGVQKHKVHGGNRIPRVFKPEQERELAEIVRFCDRRGFQLTMSDFAHLAFQYGADQPDKMRPKYCDDIHRCKMGRKWLKGFLQRNPDIVEKLPQSLSVLRALCATKKNLWKWFGKMKEMLIEEDKIDKPQNIWNVDEIGVCDLQKMVKTLCVSREGAYQVTGSERGKLTTVLALVNAAGVVVPPMVIFKGERVQAQWLESAPKNVTVRATKSGYINSTLFYDYMKIFVHFLSAIGKLHEGNVLMLDCHYSHIFNLDFLDLMKENKIRVWALHPHTTHAVQPLDSHPFKALKKEMNAGLRQYNRDHVGKTVTKPDFFKILTVAWTKAMNVATIQAGFRDCGIVPFNPEAVNWKRLFPDGSEKPDELGAEQSSESPKKILFSLHVCRDKVTFACFSCYSSELKNIINKLISPDQFSRCSQHP